jgi:hypothetical protein
MWGSRISISSPRQYIIMDARCTGHFQTESGFAAHDNTGQNTMAEYAQSQSVDWLHEGKTRKLAKDAHSEAVANRRDAFHACLKPRGAARAKNALHKIRYALRTDANTHTHTDTHTDNHNHHPNRKQHTHVQTLALGPGQATISTVHPLPNGGKCPACNLQLTILLTIMSTEHLMCAACSLQLCRSDPCSTMVDTSPTHPGTSPIPRDHPPTPPQTIR